MKHAAASLALASLCLTSCGEKKEVDDESGSNDSNTNSKGTTVEVYGKKDGQDVKIFTLRNKNGMLAKVTEYGAILVSLEVPDKDGNLKDVTHGYDDLDGWLTNTSYFGATVGRYGNRIAKGKFSIDDEEYTLAVNNGENHLHGGEVGFDKVIWSGKAIESGVELTYTSTDGEEGYPGNLDVTVTYTLNDENELKWTVVATTDKTTVVNVVQHAYWNLSGDPTTSINDHELTIDAEHFLATDVGMIPSGLFAPVEGTPFDFRTATAIEERIDDNSNIQMQLGKGYDHCFVLPETEGVRFAAKLRDPKTGRTMEVHTDQPGIQFYGGNFLNPDEQGAPGKGGIKYPHRSACCLETQFFPDSPNKQDNPRFQGCILKPGDTYTHTMINKFSW